jgi:hypothetical protein
MGEACRMQVGDGNSKKVLVNKPESKGPLRGIGVDGRIILKWILKK